jgi:hypothetical protein
VSELFRKSHKLIIALCCGSGLAEGSPSHNFIADVPFMVGIVESILTERFLLFLFVF